MRFGALLAAAVAGGVTGAALVSFLPRDPADVRGYLMAHPEVVADTLRRYQVGQVLAADGPAITTPFGSAWAGNPKGDVVLVEYYDYNCGYCRASLPAIRELIASDPGLKVVFRELPVLADSSRDAARISLVAATQGKFAAFHDALFAGGPVSADSIAAAARRAGVDTTNLTALAPQVDAEIARNLDVTRALGITGTPSWVVGDRVMSGAFPVEELRKAVAEVRGG